MQCFSRSLIYFQELFIAHLTEESHKNTDDEHLEYKNVADVVQFNDVYDFLRGIDCVSLLSVTHFFFQNWFPEK